MHQVTHAATANPLLPNGTFIAELVAFALVFAVLGLWVLPPLTRAITRREQTIQRRQEQIRRRHTAAQAHRQQCQQVTTQARRDAERLRNHAQARAEQIVTAARADAAAEAATIRRQARQRIQAESRRAEARLRPHAHVLASQLAAKILGDLDTATRPAPARTPSTSPNGTTSHPDKEDPS